MRKKVIFFIGISLLCFTGWGFFLYNKPRAGVENIKPDITIKAGDLYKQYNEDEAASNTKFLNKIIRVSGTVDQVEKSDSAYIILLKQKEDAGGVSCNLFAHTNNNIQRGKTITMKGKCTGFLMDVALTDCLIEQQ